MDIDVPKEHDPPDFVKACLEAERETKLSKPGWLKEWETSPETNGWKPTRKGPLAEWAKGLAKLPKDFRLPQAKQQERHKAQGKEKGKSLSNDQSE
jgi:hypothetical protein